MVPDFRLEPQLEFLRSSPRRSVNVVTLGSLSGLASLLRANPRLLRRKVRSVMVFAGDASPRTPVEHNVGLDPKAFVSVMASRLKVRWIPCFDGGPWQAGTSSYTATFDSALLVGVGEPLFGWFETYISGRFGARNLWAAGLLSGERPKGARWRTVDVSFSGSGVVNEGRSRPAKLKRLTVSDRNSFEAWMVNATRRALRRVSD